MNKKIALQGNKKLLKYTPLLLILLFPVFFRNYKYGMMLLCFSEIYIIATSGLDVLYGYSGQISFCTAGFLSAVCDSPACVDASGCTAVSGIFVDAAALP